MTHALPVIHPTHSGFSRKAMPQIHDTQDFLAYLEADGIRHQRVTVSPHSLRPTQNEINLNLVMHLIEKGLDTEAHPLIIASDNHIIDGHNRWYAGTILRVDLTCIRVDLGLHALLRHAEAYPGATHESVAELKP